MMNSAKLKAKLEALQAELSIAIKKRSALEADLGRTKARIEQLRSTWGGSGEIENCQRELEAALRIEADTGKRRIRIPGTYGGEFVVAKVTPKRIFLRRPGGASTLQYGHDGKAIGYGNPIPPEDLTWILAQAGKGKKENSNV